MADFRRETDVRAHNLNAGNLLQPLVTCGICMELYVDPVEFLNCLHLACGACAVEWLANSSTCPQCRENVHGTRDSHYAAAVTDAYQAIAPNSDLCRARTADERRALREKYRPGQGLVSRNQTTHDQSRRPEPPTFDFGPYTPDIAQFATGAFTAGFRQTPNMGTVSERPLSFDHAVERSTVNLENMSSPQSRCLSCGPNNATGYVCPQRVLFARHTIPAGHTICGICARFLPWRDDRNGSRCVVCTRTTCHEMEQTCRGLVTQQLQLFALQDVEFPPGWVVPLGRAFGENPYEQDTFRTYLNLHGMSLRDIFREILAFRGAAGLPRANWHGPGFSPHNTTCVDLSDKTCLYCALDLVEASLFDWWLSKQPTANLPNDHRNRRNCQYGIVCSTARRDHDHARDLNHICQPTHTDRSPGSRQQDVPDNGNRFVAESGTLSRTFPPYSPSEVIFRDKGNEPMFLCSAIHRDHRGVSTIPGRATIWSPSNVTVYFGLDGDEIEQDGVVQVLLDTRGMRWVRTSRGVVPMGCRPVVGGRMALNGSNQELYHCAVWWRGQRVPGYTSPQMGRAAISWGGSEWYVEDQYELLCWS
ncbi:hypothetical protein FRC08_001475 [Ceratobasidium sp. 394]|nr:hypothetical protein FRC08_001475 [Ceratobasidium sp. 394]